MKARSVELLLPISITITEPERTLRWGKTRRSHARFNRQKSGRSWRYRRWVDCTTATNDAPPEKPEPRPGCRRFRFDIYAELRSGARRLARGLLPMSENTHVRLRRTEHPGPDGIFVSHNMRYDFVEMKSHLHAKAPLPGGPAFLMQRRSCYLDKA